jgi:hypothetical protein
MALEFGTTRKVTITKIREFTEGKQNNRGAELFFRNQFFSRKKANRVIVYRVAVVSGRVERVYFNWFLHSSQHLMGGNCRAKYKGFSNTYL